MMTGEPLTGGNTTVVVRVGDTVRRPVGHWTPAVHDLLVHLERAGFDGSPQVLGIDDENREILRFVEGEVGTLSPESPLPVWFRTPEACHAVGAWIRGFQEAQRGFRPARDKPWRRVPGGDLDEGQVVVHHDVSSYNTVRRPDGSLVVVDWDFARPGDPIEDLAWAAWLWVPLRAGSWWHLEYGTGADDLERHRRDNLVALLDGYGPSSGQRARLAEAIRNVLKMNVGLWVNRTTLARMGAVRRGSQLVFECSDPADLAGFWRRVLDLAPPTGDTDRQVLEWEPVGRLAFQRVPGYVPPEWPGLFGEQQSHIDLLVDDLVEACARVERHGAVPLSPILDPGPSAWRIYADPEGHPFCLVASE